MKRSKKAGGYNLRKSLAWDRAFLTEEGVLDDSELSMICGTIGGTNNPVTDEQGRDSLPVNSSSTNLETLEEDQFKEFPSDYPNKSNATSNCSKSHMKRDSTSGGCLASVSKSAQKVVSPGHGLKKVVCKGEVYSPMTSVSQKRLSNTGTKQISTRNSKIPKVSVSKKNSSLPSMTTIHSAAGGSSLIPQPVARKSLSSKIPSKAKHASDAAEVNLGSVPKCNKPSANVGNEVTNSALRRNSLVNSRIPHTTIVNKNTANCSSQGLLSGGVNTVKSSDKTSSTASLSHFHSDNAGLNMSNAQVQGLKSSGLRMPSPSLRFFSETKAPVSNTSSQVNSMPHKFKSDIPNLRKSEVADHNNDIKPTQLSFERYNVDAMGKAGMCLKKIDKCLTSSTAVHNMPSNAIHVKCNQQASEVKVPVEDKNSVETKNKQFRNINHNRVEEQSKAEMPISSKVEEKNWDNNSTCSDIEFVEASYEPTILSQDKRTTNKSMLQEFGESCPEAQLFKTCEKAVEVQSPLFEGLEYNSSVKNDDALLESQSISHHNSLMLASDINQSSRILEDSAAGENNSSDLDQTNSQRSIMEHFGEVNLLVNEKSTMDEHDSALSVCTGNAVAGQDSIFSDGETGICSANGSVAGLSEFKHGVDKQDKITYDSNLSAIRLSESSEVQEKAIENLDMWQRNSNNHGTKDICADNLDLVELSNHYASTVPELLNEVPVEFNHLCNSDQDDGQSLLARHGVSDNCASAHGTIKANNQCEEIMKDSYAEAEKQMMFNNKLPRKEMKLQGDEAGRNGKTVSQDNSYSISQENNSPENVKDQINLLSCLPNNSNDSTLQSSHLEIQLSGKRCKVPLAIPVANPEQEGSLSPVNKHELSPQDLLSRETLEETIELDKPGCNLSPREASIKVFHHDDWNEKTVSQDNSYSISQVNNMTENVKDQINLLSCLPNNSNDSTLQSSHLEIQSSGKRCKVQLAVPVANPEPEGSLSPVNKHELSPQYLLLRGSLEECIELDKPDCKLSPREARMKVFHHDGLTDESACNKEAVGDEDAFTKQRTESKKLTRPPQDVVPFSDEWLAAIESAGEEILTLKTGAVKHSPPDKSVSEPGPWSPVKRKTGPFDCTKYTNAQPDNIN